MPNSELKKIWFKHYQSATDQLEKMTEVKGLISAFNANINAVIKVSGQQIEKIIEKHLMNQGNLLIDGDKSIKTNEDAVRGLIHCFKSGIAEEWLIENKEVFDWLNENIGYGKMQMGGQGGIVANVMAICRVDPVYVHTASSPEEQSKLFLDLPNPLNPKVNS